MTIQEFCVAQTASIEAFKLYWASTIYPAMDYEDQQYWDYQATLWDWVEQYEAWFAINNAEL